MKANWPSFGAYLILYNAEVSQYPWRECIRNALTFCDHVYILECNSEDDTYDRIVQEFSDVPNITLKRSETNWDMSDTLVVGKKKQEARSMVQTDYCVYLDADEILLCRDRNVLIDLVLHHPDAEAFCLPYITFFGSPYEVGSFENSENYWRWKILKNVPHLGHGAHGKARKYDGEGKVYIDKSISDGCEIINLETLEIVSSLMYFPTNYAKAGELYKSVPKSPDEKKIISTVFSEIINDFPLVCLHYGWIDFTNKVRNAKEYWTKTKAFKSGGVEHSRLFDGLSEDAINAFEGQEQQIKNTIGAWKGMDTIALKVKKHPDIIRPKIGHLLKPKILNVALASTGPFGVPKWGHQLKYSLSDYDVQTYAFNDYVTNTPPNAMEFHKAESFVKYIKQSKNDEDALVLFGDGFWAATYPGPAKVISVVHGLWSHPLRDKWDDGLLEQRKQLFEYQLRYFRSATQMGHTLVCVSPFIHKVLREEHGIDSILIPNAVDLEMYDRVYITEMEKDRPLILHGITSDNKGLDILQQIENHPLIKDKFDIGSIDEISAHAQIPKMATFKAADVAFLPTKWEASSYLLLECLANNLPIAAHRAGILNCKELEHIDQIGVIVDDYEVDKLAEAIVEAYENSDKYRNGRNFVKANNMTLDKWSTSIKNLIYEVL
jgi:glycosyltransferase involved in cell wall biosynthesis